MNISYLTTDCWYWWKESVPVVNRFGGIWDQFTLMTLDLRSDTWVMVLMSLPITADCCKRNTCHRCREFVYCHGNSDFILHTFLQEVDNCPYKIQCLLLLQCTPWLFKSIRDIIAFNREFKGNGKIQTQQCSLTHKKFGCWYIILN